MRDYPRALFILLCVLLSFAAAPATAGRMVVHDPAHTDRPGNDFAHAALPRPDPDLCVRQCAFNQGCAAYTYVRPGIQGPTAMCWLKRSPPRPARNACCESGVLRYIADRPPQRPARINPPESPNRQFCSMGMLCSNRAHGHWSEEMQTCDCPVPTP